MKTKNEIKVSLYRVVGDVAALIKVKYLDRDSQEKTGLLLLDSGCNLNILSPKMADCIVLHPKRECDSTTIISITGDKVPVNIVPFAFELGGVQFNEKFCINDNQLPPIGGEIPLIGLLGNKFMLTHCLAIDFSDFTFHTSHINSENLAASDCEYFFPMEIGLKYYGLPVLSMGQGDKEVVAIADTGATNNMISAPALSDDGFHCEYLDSTDTIKGINGTVETKDAVLSFNLPSLSEEDVVQHKDIFKVLPQYIIGADEVKRAENGEHLPPVEALIGCPFMAKEGWVLDYGLGIIIKRKQSE